MTTTTPATTAPEPRRWKASYTYACGGYCGRYGAYYCPNKHKGARHQALPIFLNDSEQEAGPDAVRAHIEQAHRVAGVEIVAIFQESDEELQARLARTRREEAAARRGAHWNMGGAN